MPAKFREQLGSRVVVTRGLDGCLTLHTCEAWEQIITDLMKLPATKKDARTYIHLLTAKACECEFDAQGRILIPSNLVHIANLSKKCIFVGALNRIELWDEQRWNDYYQEASEHFEEIAEAMTDYIL